MKFANVNNVKTEAQKGFSGCCPICGSKMISKCGYRKMHHWSHKSIRNCDPWWESETEWHRNWKNNYPTEWQEYSFKDFNSNEKHIADIHTNHNLVIEFQHSNIDPNEQISRESFYKNMIWVVDGTRLKRDFERFEKTRRFFKETEKKGIFKVDFIQDVFSPNWLNRNVPVLFDFKGEDLLLDDSGLRKNLFCLLPLKQGRYSFIAEISREAFIKTTISGEWSARIQLFLNDLIGSFETPITIQDLNTKVIQREGTHYYDPKKGRLLKKWRF